MKFIDNATGWISGASGTILKTTDGGNSWNLQATGTNFALFSVDFIDADKGWASGPLGTLLHTTDGGNNWTADSLFTPASFENVFFVSPQTGWIVGDAGMILKTTTGGGGGTVFVSEDLNSNPDEFYLSQNYPNPFNPKTNFEFRIANLGFVSLKVYDILGSEVATLVNEIKQPGTYKIEFDATKLSSGVYFYRLEAGKFSETKKLMLMK
jgi:hypothetical protein